MEGRQTTIWLGAGELRAQKMKGEVLISWQNEWGKKFHSTMLLKKARIRKGEVGCHQAAEGGGCQGGGDVKIECAFSGQGGVGRSGPRRSRTDLVKDRSTGNTGGCRHRLGES